MVFLIAALGFSLFAQSPKDAADALYRQRKFIEAAHALEKHLAEHPNDFSSRLLLGLCYQQVDENHTAEAVLREAVRQRPNEADARYYLARVQYLLAKFAEAEQNARLSMKLGGTQARAYNLIGLVLSEKDDNEKALEAYQAAIRADPKGFADGYLNAGRLLLKLNQPSKALRYLQAAMKVNPRSAETLYQRARAYLELKKVDEAKRNLVAALSLSNHEQSRRLLAQLRAGGFKTSKSASKAITALSPIRFRNVAESANVRFVLENHPTPQRHLIETMPGGIAVFDYNNDGRTDIYFTNGATIPSLQKSSTKYFNRLYRNDGKMRFTDVTSQAGVAGAGYSMGAAAADYDNDGHIDLFVAGVNRNILFHNTRAGTFEDVTSRAGIKNPEWSVAAGWFDYDNDGQLDLFVVNYVKWSPSSEPFCGDPATKLRIYCHPKQYQGLSNTLYRNRSDGTFEDVSERAGLAAHVGKGMSLALADYNQDGLTDVFVANDTVPNFLFRNQGDGTFEETALVAGVALTDEGKAISSMGVDFRDYDNDGLPDLSVTALAGETFPLFRNQGGGFFRDATYASRVGLLSARRSGWSNGFFDLNNDGWKDLFSANSHVTDNIELFSQDKYRQANSLFANVGNGTFKDVSAEAGQDFQTPRPHRGSAFADFNQDGKMDIVVSSLGEPAELWENISPENNHWISIKLQGTKSNRDGISARVRLHSQYNHMTTSVGYASSSYHGVHFGTGSSERLERIDVYWPSGAVQVVENVKTDQVLRIQEPDR